MVAVFAQDTQSICGKGMEVVSTKCLGDSLVKSQARATAKMSMGGCCTAWLVKDATADRGALMLTTGHCASKTSATFIFDYANTCGSSSGGSESNKCLGKRISAETVKDEQGIYELEKSCSHADTVTPIHLDVGIPDVGEGMYVIGHPMCKPQVLSHQEAHDEGHHCEVRKPSFSNGKSLRASYYCDTQGGNSGSPVFSARTGYAFAIHSHGGCRTSQQSANSGGLLGNSGVIKAFDEFQIPYVNRKAVDLMKYEEFIEEQVCFDHDQFVDINQKSLSECKALSVNSLVCVGVEYSVSKNVCSVNYRSAVSPKPCQGNATYFRRAKTLTTKLMMDGVVPKPLTPASGFCGFESKAAPYCGIWHQSAQDQFDWTQQSGSTKSSNTGPSSAHSGSYYVYTEVSSPVQANDHAILQALTPTIKKGGFLSFYYHMMGASLMGSLKVKVLLFRPAFLTKEIGKH